MTFVFPPLTNSHDRPREGFRENLAELCMCVLLVTKRQRQDLSENHSWSAWFRPDREPYSSSLGRRPDGK